MKKYLITSAAALALCGLITSCSHDIDGLTPEESVAATYEKAFITAFGQPAPDQTWGFGTSIAASRGMTRAANMPSMPTFRDGTEGLPNFAKPTKPTYDVSSYEDKTGQTFNVSNAENGKYKIDGSSTIYDLGNYGCSLYVVGNTTLTSFSAHGTNIIVAAGKKLTLGSMNQHVDIYLEENAELDIRYSLDWQGNVSYDWQGKTGDFTFDNNNTVSNIANLYMAKGSKVYGSFITFKNGYKVLNEGGTITTTDLTVYDSNTSPSTLWNEGGVTVTGNLSCENQNAYVYNGNNHTISVGGQLRLINNYDLVYNNGTIDITGDIYMENTSAEIINNDSLLCASDFDMKAGGAFHNVGIADISGTTYIYNTNSRWMNDGYYTTGTFEDQNCEQVYNNCHMTVTGTFHLGQPAAANGHSFFVLNGGEGNNISGAYVKCNEFIYGGNTDLWLGNKSFIEVTNNFKNTNFNSGFEVHGPASGSYAVIKATSFTQEGTYIKYTGNLFIDTPSHFDTGYVKETSVQGNCWGDNCPVSIPKTECNPGYNTDIEPEGDVVRVVAEDLTASAGNDFDFNDVVFDVELKDNNVVYVYVRAAGGTLPLYLGEGDEAVEVHGLFGKDTNIMINTGAEAKGYANSKDGLAPKGISLRNPLAGQADADNVRQVAKAIKVVVIKNVNGTSTPCELKAEQGEATAKLCVGTDYQYTEGGKTYPCLTERTDIKGQFIYNSDVNSIYRGQSKFPLYVKGIFDDNWYKSTAEPK